MTGRRMNVYDFHVTVTAPDRGHARGWLAAALGTAGDEFTMSEYTAGLVAAIEARGELQALRALLDEYGEANLEWPTYAEAYKRMIAVMHERIAELEQADDQ